MKETYRQISLSRFCRLLGVTRQAYYQSFWQDEFQSVEDTLILQQVLRIRANHKHMGGRKLYSKLEPFLAEHRIKIGRDGLFDLLQRNGLLVRRRKRRVYTTNSFHWFRRYPNKIKNMKVTKPNQIWVSDITYWKIDTGNLYISLITDSYSRKIVGYHVAETLETVETMKALRKALDELTFKPQGLIHHSDRGIQYCCNEYVKLLQDYDIQTSMTENGDPYENAQAERVNGILKEEYLTDYPVQDIQQARLVLQLAVELYNTDRPHMSCGYNTPEYVHSNSMLK